MKEIMVAECVTSNTSVRTHKQSYPASAVLTPCPTTPLIQLICLPRGGGGGGGEKPQQLTKCEQMFGCACVCVRVCVCAHSILK